MGDPLYQIRIDGRLMDGVYSGELSDVQAYAQYYGGYQCEVIDICIKPIPAGYAKSLADLELAQAKLESELETVKTQILQLRK